ncbi:hypothetical protein L1987_85076 [Smallanthus sonchifolius]|uniref:Uncharacterized protein n=1 Tax=Smallanthus sonchifolius TaxID=185202 RepID=A0ACB8XWK4_9ASTR|nr:hypothetical protein L1987_85076 [Smallanthus sonchifolius]
MEKRRLTKTKLIFSFLVVLHASITCIRAVDGVSANQTLRYNETIVSPQETFELGFFNPGNSMNHYVGIWYKISKGTVVWVANRNAPLNHTSGELTLTLQGVLVLRDATTGNVVWSSANTSSTTSVRNPVGQLLETGNFIIYEEGDVINQEDPIWQSFDFLTDTLLPGMKQGWDLVKGIERGYSSWKSNNDPASGEFFAGIDKRGYPQMILMDGQELTFRAGPWNGVGFSGAPNLRQNLIFNFTFVINQNEIYYQYNLVNSSVYSRLVLQPSGRIERLLWIDSRQDWSLYSAPENDRCDQYAVCGPFGSCSIDKSPVCECLKGFEPTSPDQWRVADWSQGCRHTRPLDCDPAEGFNKFSNLKLPDTRGSWYNQTMTLVECEKMCKSNCSCTAYTNSNISGTGSGCLLWFGDLIDIRTFAQNGETLYIRLPSSELDSTENSNRSGAGRRRVQVIVPVAFAVLIILVSIRLFYRFNGKNQQRQGTQGNSVDRSEDEDLDQLPLFGLSTILKATNNFSMNMKLGEGGFGPVFKISDFGMARTFGGNQIEANTNRVVGTYGYMAPEYAGNGIFSTKSDVYSFGILVLEIVCGEKNRGFIHKDHQDNLIGHAWELHNEGRSLQLVAKCLGESFNVSQALRSIHVGLLCVQRSPEDRPTMTSAILMLESESPLPSPKEPGFYVEKTKQDTPQSSSSYGTSSNNELTITMLNGR